MIPFMIWNRQQPDDDARIQPHDDEAGRTGLQPDTAVILDTIARAVPDPFIMLDDSGIILSHNKQATELTGQDMIGQHLSQHIRAPAVLEAMERVVDNGAPDQVHYERRTGGGRLFEVFITPVAALDVARVPAVTVLLRDLSTQQQLEKMRADFVANASHELRTPLASLTGFIETLQGSARNDAKARDKFLGRMLEQAHRMRRLIDDLLSLSRIEMNLHRTPSDQVDMSEVARYCVEVLATRASEAVCEIRVDAPLGMIVNGERDELIQITHNLIENAIKYGASGRGVDVSVAHNTKREQIELAVTDYGAGIDAQHLPRLTERFYRVSVQESRSGGGTGLGLAIVKHIALRHRGNLDITSRKGEGSTFKFTLPVSRDLAKSAE
jgi:two-component system phosphate regulon sensor histidine kinase PhoR